MGVGEPYHDVSQFQAEFAASPTDHQHGINSSHDPIGRSSRESRK